MNRPIFVFIAIITYGILLGGCGQKELGDEPTKYASQDGLEQLTKQAAQGANTATQSGASNPKFKSSSDKQPTSEAVKNLDAAIRPVLVQQFGAAKLIEEENEPVTQKDGEIVLNSMKYVVGKMLNEANVRQLHTALKNAHFTPSPRLGSEPTIARLWAAISLFKHTAGIQYTLVFKINFKTQIMTVESYQLSRYDHLM